MIFEAETLLENPPYFSSMGTLQMHKQILIVPFNFTGVYSAASCVMLLQQPCYFVEFCQLSGT